MSPKPQRCVIVSLSGVDDKCQNPRPCRKKVWVWNEEEINVLMRLYDDFLYCAMIIGVPSDTHSLVPPPKLLEGLKGVDLIVHAGDVCAMAGIKGAGNYCAPAVQGNMDEPALKKEIAEKNYYLKQRGQDWC